MPGLYVYGISARPLRLRTRGVFRRQLRSITLGPLHVVVEHAGRPPKLTIRNLKTQSRIIAALVASGADVLPARFGAFVPDRAELQRLIGVRHPDLVRALRRIRGRVQMTVRVRCGEREPQERPRAKTRGTRYLEARAHLAQERRDPIVSAIQRAARPYSRESRVDWRTGPPLTANVYHLVLRTRIDRYEEAVARAVWRRGAHAAISGPWAPFAFAEVA